MVKTKLITDSPFGFEEGVNDFIEKQKIMYDDLIDIKFTSCFNDYTKCVNLNALIIYKTRNTN